MNKKLSLAYFKDGPFLPPREGGSIVTLNTLRNVDKFLIRVVVIRCFRGWDNPELYKNENFKIYMLQEKDYFFNFDLLKKIISKHNIKISIFESVEAGLLHIPYFRKNIKDMICITDCHNIEYRLMEQLKYLPNHVLTMKEKEKKMLEISDGILVRSEKDKSDLIALNINNNQHEKIQIVKNCIPIKHVKWKLRMPKRYCVYLGHMYYRPNQECVEILAESILPKLWKNNPEWRLKIIGIGPNNFFHKFKDPRINFVGGKEHLNKELEDTYIALCPIQSGSGTRLKILDFFASGIPVVGTSLCIEGLEDTIKENMIIEDNIENYVNHAIQLYDDEKYYEHLCRRGLIWVKHNRNCMHMTESFAKAIFQIANGSKL